MRKLGWMLRLIAAFVIFAAAAWPWGPEGHEIVARIAAANLNSHAAQEVASLLGVSVDSLADAMAAASTWADAIRPSHPETGGWHFVDIPRDQPDGKPSDFCPNSDCVSFRLADFAARLKNNTDGPGSFTRVEQLKFVIHFAGDIHQPLHDSTNSDRGGNCVTVTNHHNDNLHHAWDTDLVADLGSDDTQTAAGLASQYAALTDAQKIALIAGTPDDWAMASHQLGIGTAYGLLGSKVPLIEPQVEVKKSNCSDAPAKVRALKVKLGPSYVTASESVVQDQLIKAGARLAALLNSIWPVT